MEVEVLSYGLFIFILFMKNNNQVVSSHNKKSLTDVPATNVIPII